MATYALQGPAHGGAAITGVTPANGDLAPTGNGIGLLIINPSTGTAITVAIPIPNVDGTQAVTSRTVSIGIGQNWIIPLPDSVYGAGLTGALTYTGTLTSVLVSAIRIP